jgi:hypothetical protein
MKKLLSLFAGIVLVLAFGMAYADELRSGDGYASDKMIRDEDIQKYDQDMGPGTTNQMPALPEIQGSAPGGVSGGDDSYDKPVPAEQDTTKPSDSGDGMGGPSKSWDPYRY